MEKKNLYKFFKKKIMSIRPNMDNNNLLAIKKKIKHVFTGCVYMLKGIQFHFSSFA